MNVLTPTFEDTMRYGKWYNRTVSGTERDPSLCGSITRGMQYRNLAGRMAAMSGGKTFPYDEELDYLESSGNQRIEMGGSYTSKNHKMAVESEVCRLVYERIKTFPFASDGPLYLGLSYYGTRQREYWASCWNDEHIVYPSIIGEKIKLCISNYNNVHYLGSNWFDGYNKTVSDPYTNMSFGLFCIATGINVYDYNANIRISFLKFWYDDVLTFDLIPVLKNGVPCMYNKVDNSFHYNAISGHQFGYKKKDGTIIEPV